MPKNYQEINLTQTDFSINMVGSPGIIEVSGVPGTATVRISPTHDDDTPVNNASILQLDDSTAGAGPSDNPIPGAEVTTGIAFNVQAERLTFSALTPDGTTDIIVRWYFVGTPY